MFPKVFVLFVFLGPLKINKALLKVAEKQTHFKEHLLKYSNRNMNVSKLECFK